MADQTGQTDPSQHRRTRRRLRRLTFTRCAWAYTLRVEWHNAFAYAQMLMEIVRDGLVSVGPILCRWAQRQQRPRHTEPHSADDTQRALEAGELLICQAQQMRERASARESAIRYYTML